VVAIRRISHRILMGSVGAIGLPSLVRGNTRSLQLNMTFSDEPGVYPHGEFGIRLEDDMRITEDGAQLLLPGARHSSNRFGRATTTGQENTTFKGSIV
jgi:Xaa-Pro aminopeptidase